MWSGKPSVMTSNLSESLSEKGVQLCEGLGRLFQARGQRLPEGYRLGVGCRGSKGSWNGAGEGDRPWRVSADFTRTAGSSSGMKPLQGFEQGCNLL